MMLRTWLIVGMLATTLTAFAPSAEARDDPCRTIDCPRPIVVVDDERACAGYETNYGGSVVCVTQDGCIERYWGYSYSHVCYA